MKTFERRTAIDLALLLSISLVLLAIHAVVNRPTAVDFYFYPANPSVLNAWTAALLHRSWNHVGNNSIAYALTVFTTYLIYWKWNRRRTLWFIVTAILVTTPLITALGDMLLFQYAIETLPEDLNIKGFSGVSSAFLGMLWASIGLYANHETESNIGNSVVFIGYLTAALYFAVIYHQSKIILFTVVGLVLFGYLWTGYRIHRTFPLRKVLTTNHLQEIASRDYTLLIIVGWSLGLLLFTMYYPASITSNGSTTNIMSHLTGLVYGFLFSTIVIKATTRAKSNAKILSIPV